MSRKVKDHEALYYFDIKIGEYFEAARKYNINFVPFSITAKEMSEKMGPSVRASCLLNYRNNSLQKSVDIALCDIKKREMHLETAEKQTTSAKFSFRLIFNSLVRS